MKFGSDRELIVDVMANKFTVHFVMVQNFQ